MYGWQEDNGVLVYLDFAELHERQCLGLDAADSQQSDYERWSPHDGRLAGKCLLGHRTEYTRRKRESQCFNPEALERVEVKENCECTEEDFECDYGYMRKVTGGPCVPDPDVQIDENKPCTDFNWITKGFERFF